MSTLELFFVFWVVVLAFFIATLGAYRTRCERNARREAAARHTARGDKEYLARMLEGQ